MIGTFQALEYVSIGIEFFLMFVKRYDTKIALLITLLFVIVIQIFDLKFKTKSV